MPLHAQPDFHTSSDNHENPLPIPPQLSSQSQPSKITQQSNDLIKQVTNTVQQFTSKSPFYNRPISEPNGEIPIRQISSPPQITPPHQLLDDSTGAPCFGLKKSGQLNSGENGVPAVQILQNQRQKRPSHRNNSFPKISTNFDAPSSSTHQLNSTLQRKSTAPPARQNVPMIPHNAVPSEPSKNNAPPPHAVKPTFASTLKSIQEQSCLRLDISPAKQTTKQGYPAVIFKREDYMVKLAERCKFTLIGKFDSTMPRMEVIRRSFEAQVQLKSTVKITHFNSKHVYIDLDNQLDHDTVWFKKTIWIQGRPMNLFTWTPTFKPSQETPIAPIWVVLPELPWHLYYMEAISELLKSVGRAISLDVATFQKTRGSVAKVKLEIDVTKIRPNYFWVGYDDDENGEGYWQEAQYEDVPSYCSYCKHQGHVVDVCAKKRRDDEMGKKKVEEILIPVEASRQSLQNQSREVRKQLPGMTIAGKPPAQKQHYIPKNPVIPISNGPNPPVHATVMARVHPISEENTGGCSASKTNELTDVVTQTHDAGVIMNSKMLSVLPKNSNATLNCARVSTNNAFALLSTDHEHQVPVSAVCTAATGCAIISPACAISEAAAVSSALQCVSVTEVPSYVANAVTEVPTLIAVNSIGEFNTLDSVRGKSGVMDTQNELFVPEQLVPMKSVKDSCVLHKSAEQNIAALAHMVNDQVDANHGELIFNGLAEIETGVTAKKISPGAVENSPAAENVCHNTTAIRTNESAHDIVQGPIDSTKAWVEKSFGKSPVCAIAPAGKQHEPTSLPQGKHVKKISTTGGKNKKKSGKKAGKSVQQTEEEVLKAEKMAFWDAILAKSYAENPVIESNNQPLNVLEITAQGKDNEFSPNPLSRGLGDQILTKEGDHKAQRLLASLTNIAPTHSSNLIPTVQLEVMCKETVKLIKQTGKQQTIPVNPTGKESVYVGEDGNDGEPYFLGDLFGSPQLDDAVDDKAVDGEPYFLGDLFGSPQLDDAPSIVDDKAVNSPNTSGTHKWNVNAPEFIPKASPQLGLGALQDDSDSDESEVSLPEDGVLLERMDLHDKKGLLRRQNTIHKDLPSKLSIVPPGFVDSDPEYEDEDDFSIAANEMHAARIGALSPRVEEIKRPKKIIRNRAPLERRTQPSRSSKMKSTRSNDYVW